jgi:signal peptidase I
MNQPRRSLWQRFKFFLTDTGKQLALAIFIVLLLRSSIIEPYKIPSGSMIPTLFIGDHIFVSKFAYGFKVPFTDYLLDAPIYITKQDLPDRGDIIVFRYPRDESLNFIKRVIGLPGDSISMRDKALYINGKLITREPIKDPDLEKGIENDYDRSVMSLFSEDLIGKKHPVLYDMNTLLGSDFGPIEVPPGKIFVMGDNRDRSNDSRAWGFVPMENIRGKALVIWLNFVFSLEDKVRVHLGLDRIGKSLR